MRQKKEWIMEIFFLFALFCGFIVMLIFTVGICIEQIPYVVKYLFAFTGASFMLLTLGTMVEILKELKNDE